MTDAGAGGAHKLWGGRFAAGPAPELEAVNRSIGVDFRLWPFDIRLSQAWALALADAGVLTADEGERLRLGLDVVARQIAGGVELAPSDEDVHTLIDRLLHAEAGDVASRLHTGRSRNDQVATATRLWVIDALARIDESVLDVARALVEQAAQVQGALMPAYTHLQRAQPVLVAHWILSHVWPLTRDRARLAVAARAASVLPLGSGAVAGSAFPVSREMLRSRLGFRAISQNSVDAVSDRDFVVEALTAVALLTAHLSRLAEDLILFGSAEFGFVRFSDSYSTGSSMMPQKRNPDALELARASAPRALGDLVAMLATIKGLPTGYNKDLQEDKRALFDATDCVILLLPAVAGTVRTLSFDRARMRAAITSPMMATDLADLLVRRGMSFRESHSAVGRLVRVAEERGVDLAELAQSEFLDAHPAFGADALGELDAAASVAHRELPGGTGPAAVASQLETAVAALSASHESLVGA